MNIPLLLKVKAAILAEPAKFDMDEWVARDPSSPCGTTCCIAGHAVAIQQKFESLKELLAFPYSVWSMAQDSTELDYQQTKVLFFHDSWPSEFANRYRNCKTPRGRAKVAADRIDRFIESEGRV